MIIGIHAVDASSEKVKNNSTLEDTLTQCIALPMKGAFYLSKALYTVTIKWPLDTAPGKIVTDTGKIILGFSCWTALLIAAVYGIDRFANDGALVATLVSITNQIVSAFRSAQQTMEAIGNITEPIRELAMIKALEPFVVVDGGELFLDEPWALQDPNRTLWTDADALAALKNIASNLRTKGQSLREHLKSFMRKACWIGPTITPALLGSGAAALLMPQEKYY